MAKRRCHNQNHLAERARQVIRESRVLIADRRDETERLNRSFLRFDQTVAHLKELFQGDGNGFFIRGRKSTPGKPTLNKYKVKAR
jgi:hypothetical protein